MPAQVDDDVDAELRQFFFAIFAHGSARVLSKAASAPLERAKICLQVAAPPARPALGKVTSMLRDIVATQGVRALWRGCGTHIVGTGLGATARLGVLRTSQMWAMPRGDRHYQGIGAYVRRCAFLSAAGAAALAVAYPLDVAYTCLAADAASPRRFRGFFHLARFAVKRHGVLSLYRGFPLCLGTAVPFIAVATAVHDLLSPRLLKQMGRPPQVDHTAAHNPGDLFWLVREGAPVHLYPWNLLVGTASGLVAQSVTYPLDTVRRRLQHTCAQERLVAPLSVRECAAQLYRAGGWRAFYAGFGANAAKMVPELAVLCSVYLTINASGQFV